MSLTSASKISYILINNAHAAKYSKTWHGSNIRLFANEDNVINNTKNLSCTDVVVCDNSFIDVKMHELSHLIINKFQLKITVLEKSE